MSSSNVAWVLTILIVLSSATLFAGEMKPLGVVISPFPSEGDEIQPKRLAYGGAEARREIHTLRLDLESEEGEDPVRAAWTLTGSSMTASPQRVNLRLILLDEDDQRLATVSKIMMLRGGAREQQKIVKMEVPAERWQAARKLEVEAFFEAPSWDWLSAQTDIQ